VFYGMFGAAIFRAFRTILLARNISDPEIDLLVPAALALVNFIVIKSVFSQDDNHPVVFMLLALVVVLVWRSRGGSVSANASIPLVSRHALGSCDHVRGQSL
jgi:hypothetical protein